VVFESQIDAELAGMVADFLESAQHPRAGTFFGVAALDAAGENPHSLAAQTRRVFDPAFDVGNLFLEARIVADAEIVADRRAANVQAQPRAAPLEVGKVARRRLREVISGKLDRIEGPAGGHVDEVLKRHGRPGLAAQIERLAKTVGGQAQAHPRPAGAADRVDGRCRGCVNAQGGAGSQGAAEKLTTCWHDG
jgi:hypothetical protein